MAQQQQTRAVMPARYVAFADELLEATGIDSYSQLIGVLLGRYGKHLLATWEVPASPHPHPIPVPAGEPGPAPTAPEPFTQMEF